MTLGDDRTEGPWWGDPWDEREPRGSAPVAHANGSGLPGADGVTDLDLDRDLDGETVRTQRPDAAGEEPAGYAVFGATPVATAGGHDEGGGSHHRRWLLVIAALAGIVLFTGIGAAIGVHVGRDDAKGTDVTMNKSGKVASAPVVNSNGSTTIEAVAAAVQPAVVSISETTSQIRGTGSGVVIDAERGYIMTNNHVVSAVANGGGKVMVTTSDGRTATAEIVGRDPTSDIAVVRVRLDHLTQAQIGDSSTLKVGQTLVAFGSPLGLQGTVTSGIVSALDRPVSTQDTTGTGDNTQATIDAIQTDAAINPGNSGGALVDGAGKLIGINSAIASTSTDSTSESGSIGVGFAIPINEAIKVAQQIIATGHAVHPVVGASVSDSTSDVNGALIRDVTAGGPAADAGLRVGDVITQVDSRAVVDADSAIVAIRKDHDPGDHVQIKYVRDGAMKTTTLTLAASDPSP